LISDNRVTVGFGVGWLKEEFDAMGVDFHTRGKRADEMIAVLHKLWRGGVVSHQGQFFNFTDVIVEPTPTRPLRLYCGGSSPPALRRAAYLCDGWIGHGHTVEEVPILLRELERLRGEAGRSHLPFETIVPLKPMMPLPDVDTLKRLEELGVTGIWAPPLDVDGADRRRSRGLSTASWLDEKKKTMERYAREVIEQME
jgi:hypothetical protein